ncbi:MAG: hypothetical protein WDZ96_06050 [Acidimicrobiia bacterium]
MSDERRVDRSGIHIEKDLARSVAIEEELDANVVGPYRFPPPTRRRSAGWVFVVAAGIVAATVDGGWLPAVGLLLLAGWQFLSAWPLNVDEHRALGVAASSVTFPVGHASGAVTFKGWRSRPRWAMVLYSATEPPDQRALVVVDAVEGTVVEEVYVEDVPGV